MIEIRNLTKKFDKVTAVSKTETGFDVSIASGKTDTAKAVILEKATNIATERTTANVFKIDFFIFLPP